MMNQSSIDRGFFRSMFFRTYRVRRLLHQAIFSQFTVAHRRTAAAEAIQIMLHVQATTVPPPNIVMQQT